MICKLNRKTPNFAYGNFSFKEKEFNMGLEENSAEFSQIENQRFSTSPNPNIMFNKLNHRRNKNE